MDMYGNTKLEDMHHSGQETKYSNSTHGEHNSILEQLRMCKLRHVIADNNMAKHNQKDVATTITTFQTCTVDVASYITPVNFWAFHTMDPCNFLTTPHKKTTSGQRNWKPWQYHENSIRFSCSKLIQIDPNCMILPISPWFVSIWFCYYPPPPLVPSCLEPL